MTDNEIISGLKKLVRRQKTEIERLQKDGETIAIALLKAREDLKTAKSEAIKEFAERLKSTMFNEDFLLCEPCDMANIIDNLVKEMKEDEGE